MTDSLFDSRGNMPILDGMRYFYTKTDDCSFLPAMELTMADPVDLPCLQSAVEAAMARFRVFRLVVVQEGESYYLRDNPEKPIVHVHDGSRHVAGTAENNGHLTRVTVNGSKILLEFFHGISDGHGAYPFLTLMLRKYCALRYGEADIPAEDPIYREDPRECMESMAFIDETREYTLKKTAPAGAFQIPEEMFAPENGSFIYELDVDAAAFDAYMRRQGGSRTGVFALFMDHAICDVTPPGDAPIITGVAADVRRIYGAEASMRDCTDTIPLVFDREMQALPIPEQMQLARKRILENMDPELRLASACEAKKNYLQLEKRLPTLKGKKLFSRRLHGMFYKSFTYHLSAVGKISFGPGVDPHVVGLESRTYANVTPIILVIQQFGDNYHICYCTRVQDDPYVRRLQARFLEAGIPCSCLLRESPQEPLVVF